jgi:DNA mismatch repair protein MutS
MLLTDEYFSYQSQYQAQYGINTIVLMEIGSFFEMYATQGTMLHDIGTLLNIQVTRKNKSLPLSHTNPMLAGFPSSVLHKYLDMLIQEKYTIVLVEQTSPPPNPERKVTQIISPATYMDSMSSDSRFMVCIYVAMGTNRERQPFPFLTMSYADLTTGETFVIEERMCESSTIVTEITRLLIMYAPKELVIIAEDIVPSDIRVLIQSYLKQSRYCFQDRMDVSVQSFQKLSYQKAVLQKVYPCTGLLSPIEYVGLERHPTCLVAFTYLLQFIYEHNELLLKTLRSPVYRNNTTWVTHMSLEQLNILPKSGNDSSIVQLLNTCHTPMGKRRFVDRIIHPEMNQERLNVYYDRISDLQCQVRFETVLEYLRPIKDLERMFRRMQLGKLKPTEATLFFASIHHSCRLSEFILSQKLVYEWSESYAESLYEWSKELSARFPALMVTFEYQKGCIPELDEMSSRITRHQESILLVIEQANAIVDGFKWDGSEMTITKKRYETYLKTRKQKSPVFTTHDMTNKTMWRLSYPNLNETITSIQDLTMAYQERLQIEFQADMERYATYDWMIQWTKCIAEMDVSATMAKHASTFCYVRPTLKQETDSFIHATEVRHPLLERIGDTAYVPNDVVFDDTQRGMLLFGINFSGKSSYMKSIGVNTILAQAGMFVAAKTWTFMPYDHIFTRLPSGDNLFKGQSTFIVEMNEVRTILKHSTSRSLVLGDEIASGTETVSGIAIVAAGVMTLAQRNASFLFATHWHEVADLERIKTLKNVSMAHMAVHYDETHGRLVYDRVLKPGIGSRIYGLEVCESLDLPLDFMHLAHQVRHAYLDMPQIIVPEHASKYNNDIRIDTCSVCHKPAAEVHHIRPQKEADSDGWIKGMHKNERHNLMSVCDSCHDAIHAERIKINGYQMTSQGVTLVHTTVDAPQDSSKETIQSLRRQGMSLQAISDKLAISVYKIKQLLK